MLSFCLLSLESALPIALLMDGSLLWGLQVELPLGATEDRICGTIDIEKALTEGVKAYEPGLLVSLMYIMVYATPGVRVTRARKDRL